METMYGQYFRHQVIVIQWRGFIRQVFSWPIRGAAVFDLALAAILSSLGILNLSVCLVLTRMSQLQTTISFLRPSILYIRLKCVEIFIFHSVCQMCKTLFTIKEFSIHNIYFIQVTGKVVLYEIWPRYQLQNIFIPPWAFVGLLNSSN